MKVRGNNTNIREEAYVTLIILRSNMQILHIIVATNYSVDFVTILRTIKVNDIN